LHDGPPVIVAAPTIRKLSPVARTISLQFKPALERKAMPAFLGMIDVDQQMRLMQMSGSRQLALDSPMVMKGEWNSLN
jgi:hypothetical protein